MYVIEQSENVRITSMILEHYNFSEFCCTIKCIAIELTLCVS